MLLPNDPEILLVEDNLVVVDSVIRMLSKLGYNKVESVSDYNAAVQILSLKKIHLVLIDILLSGKETGIELGGHIREKKIFHLFLLLPIQIGLLWQKLRK